MGQISAKLVKRLARDRKLVAGLRHDFESIREALDALGRGEATRIAPDVALDPLHAVYVAVQNVTSAFSERVSRYPEFQPFSDLVAEAEDEYLPGGPPMSPLTGSYFSTWAFFDLDSAPTGRPSAPACSTWPGRWAWSRAWSRRSASCPRPGWASTNTSGPVEAGPGCGN